MLVRLRGLFTVVYGKFRGWIVLGGDWIWRIHFFHGIMIQFVRLCWRQSIFQIVIICSRSFFLRDQGFVLCLEECRCLCSFGGECNKFDLEIKLRTEVGFDLKLLGIVGFDLKFETHFSFDIIERIWLFNIFCLE